MVGLIFIGVFGLIIYLIFKPTKKSETIKKRDPITGEQIIEERTTEISSPILTFVKIVIVFFIVLIFLVIISFFYKNPRK